MLETQPTRRRIPPWQYVALVLLIATAIGIWGFALIKKSTWLDREYNPARFGMMR